MKAIILVLLSVLLIHFQSLSRTKTNSEPDSTNIQRERIRALPAENLRNLMLNLPDVFYLYQDVLTVGNIPAMGNNLLINKLQIPFDKDFPMYAINSIGIDGGIMQSKYGNHSPGLISISTSPEEYTNFRTELNYNGNAPRLFDDKLVDFKNLQYLIPNDELNLNFKAPLFFIKDKRAGITVNINYKSTADPYPTWTENYILKEDVQSYLEKHPLHTADLQGGTTSNSEFLRLNDLHSRKYPANSGREVLSGYIDATIPVAENLMISVGNYMKNVQQKERIFANDLMNYNLNPDISSKEIHTYASASALLIDDEAFKLTAEIFGQASISKYEKKHPVHGTDFFKYGYVGSFTELKTPWFELGSDSVNGIYYENVWLMNSFLDTGIVYRPGNLNPLLANYNTSFFNLTNNNENIANLDLLQQNGGILNGSHAAKTYNMWNTPGYYSAPYQKMESNSYKLRGELNLEFISHIITMGIEKNVSTSRNYVFDAYSLWPLMDELTNFHLRQLNTENPQLVYWYGQVQDTILYPVKYEGNLQHDFDINLRKKLGLPLDGTDRIMIHSYDFIDHSIQYYDENHQLQTINVDPEFLSLDLFSQSELMLISNQMGYYYTGEEMEVSNNSMEIFNTGFIQPYNPRYEAFYIDYKTKFYFLDINAGFRYEIFNANQAVLDQGKQWEADYYYSSLHEIEPYYKPSETSYSLLPNINISASLNENSRINLSYNSSAWNPESINISNPYYMLSELIAYPDLIHNNGGLKPLLFNNLAFGFEQQFKRKFTAVFYYKLMNEQNSIYVKEQPLHGTDQSYFIFDNYSDAITSQSLNLSVAGGNIANTGTSLQINYAHFIDVPYYEWLGYMPKAKNILNSHLVFRSDEIPSSKLNSNFMGNILRHFSASVSYQYHNGVPYYKLADTKEVETLASFAVTNMKIEKGFDLFQNKSQINFYFMISNLFNRKNVYNVYKETGSATDDGVLANPQYQDFIANQTDPSSFRELYQLALLNPSFFGAPRMYQVGVRVLFR